MSTKNTLLKIEDLKVNINGNEILKGLNLEIKESFKNLYNTLFEGSIIRCDFFIIDDKVYLNEINSIPGSMANYLFSDFQDLFTKVASNLPTKKDIPINFEYVNKIQFAKGK